MEDQYIKGTVWRTKISFIFDSQDPGPLLVKEMGQNFSVTWSISSKARACAFHIAAAGLDSPMSGRKSENSKVDAAMHEKKGGEKVNEESVAVDGDNNDGYQTPTSPSCRIRPVVKCPPAPKKVMACRRYLRRKNWARRRVYIVAGEIESVLFPELKDVRPAKKLKRETDTDI